MDTQKRAEQWQKLSLFWSKLTPPSVPSKMDLAHIERAVRLQFQDLHGKRALILGATANFRDLLAKLHIPALIFDANDSMIKGLGSICKQTDRHETFLVGDWMQAQPEGLYDIILGDIVLNQIPEHLWFSFLARIRSWLRPGGVFIHRTLCPPQGSPPPLEEWKRRWFGRALTVAELTQAWEEEVVYYCRDEKNHEEHNHWRKQLYEKIDDGSTEAASYISQQKAFFDLFEKSWTILPANTEEKLLREHFTNIETKKSTDHPYTDLFPIYIMRTS